MDHLTTDVLHACSDLLYQKFFFSTEANDCELHFFAAIGKFLLRSVIFHLRPQVFNISEDLKAASSIITDNTPMLLEPKETIIDAQVQPARALSYTAVAGSVSYRRSYAQTQKDATFEACLG